MYYYIFLNKQNKNKLIKQQINIELIDLGALDKKVIDSI